MKNEMNFTNFAELFMKNDAKSDEIHKVCKSFQKKDEKSHEFHQKMWKNRWIFEIINEKYFFDMKVKKSLIFQFRWVDLLGELFNFPKFPIFERVWLLKGVWGYSLIYSVYVHFCITDHSILKYSASYRM